MKRYGHSLAAIADPDNLRVAFFGRPLAGSAPRWIAVDRANNVVVVGETSASGWVSGGYDVIYNGLRDAFVAHITPWVDIGLRIYDGTQTLRIACEAPEPGGTVSSPLRISKNGTTYGIVLVDPATATASKMRVQTASGIKVWQKLP